METVLIQHVTKVADYYSRIHKLTTPALCYATALFKPYCQFAIMLFLLQFPEASF